MEFQEVVRKRRMVRRFEDRPLPAGALDRILANATRAPSAGFTQGSAFVALEGPAQTARFWDRTLAPGGRSAPRWAGLVNAPAIVVALSGEAVYRARFGEPDKAGATPSAVPWWDVDCAFATMSMLLTAVDQGVGASFFSIPGGEIELLADLGVPAGYRVLGAVAVGYPAPEDRPSASVARGRKPRAEIVHRGRWQAP